MPGPSAGYNGQVQIAPNSGGAPGSWAPLANTSKATPTKKKAQLDSSIVGAGPGMRRVSGLGDLDLKIEHRWDPGDVALQSILTAMTNQDRVFSRVLRDSTKYLQAPLLPESVAFESDPGALTKVTSSLLLDAGLAAPSESAGALLVPAAMPAPVAAYKSIASITQPGASTVITGEACAQVGSTKTYQITATGHRWLDPTVAVVVKDGGSPVLASNIASINMLFGSVTFINSFTPSGSVTIDGAYLTVSQLVWVKKKTTTLKLTLKDVTDINSSGWIKRAVVGIDASVAFDVEDLSSNDPQSSGGNIGSTPWSTLLTSGALVGLEHDPDGTQTQVVRGFYNLESLAEPVAYGDIITQSFAASLNSRTNGLNQAAWAIGAP